MRKKLAASLVTSLVLAACAGPPRHAVTPSVSAPPPGAPSVPGPSGAPASSRGGERGAPPAPAEEPLVAYARIHRAELERLRLTSQQYVAHDQAKPQRFRPLRRGESVAPRRVHHARMIAFGYGAACGDRVLEKDGTVCEGAVYPGAELTPPELAKATEILRLAPDPATWRTRPSIRCFDPHHAVVFFDDQGVPVAEIDVCFECGNFTLTSVAAGERAMTDAEGMFFADTCRARNVGGCPPAGTDHMPDLPPPPESARLESMTIQEQQDHWRRRSLDEPHDLTETTRLADLSAREHKRLCAWFASATQRSAHGLECIDGRRMVVQDLAECLAPIGRGCEATVGDLAACTRSRLHTYCGVDAPGCTRTDACQKGVRLVP